MGKYTKTKYEGDDSEIYSLRLRNETAAKAGTEPGGAITSTVRAKVSKTSREFGIRPRGVRLSKEMGTAPNTYNVYRFLPLRSKSDVGNAAYADGATINFGGSGASGQPAADNWTVVGQVSEDRN